MMMTRLGTRILGLVVAVPLIACAPGPRQPQVSTRDDALLGPTSTPSCNAAENGLITAAMNVGRFVALTPEFQSCVAANYRPCAGDNAPDIHDLLATTRSPNATRVACTSTDIPNALGVTDNSDEHGVTFSGTELIGVANSFIQTASAAYAQDLGNGDYYELFHVAAIIWHEVMHVHGYQHGDNSSAKDAASDCGYAQDPTWNWRVNSANYDVETCMRGAYLKNGGQVDSRPGNASNAQTSRLSIVENAFAAAHKRETAARRAAVFNSILAGGYTPDQLFRDSSLNGIASGATVVAVNSIVQDELYDGFDRDYFAIDMARPDRVMAILLYPANTPAVPSFDFLDGIAGAERGSTNDVSYGLATITLDLPAGRHLIRAAASPWQSGSIPIQVWIQSVTPPAPTGCRGSMLCDGVVAVMCDPGADSLTLERLDGWSWTSVAEVAPVTGLDPELEDPRPTTSTAPVVRHYRVCTTSNSATSACSAEMAITVELSQCPIGLPPPHRVDCSNRANWICNTLPGGASDCHCGPYLPKAH